MIVELILQTGVAPGVCALLPLEHDRATVRHDQPGPHQQYPRLAERDLAVIDPDQASPLGDQTGAASWGVIDISVTCAVICPGRSERMPVMRAAGGRCASSMSLSD